MNHYKQGELFPLIGPEEQNNAEEQIFKEQAIVDYQIREYPIDVIVSKYTDGQEINQNEFFIPKYQRKFVWDLNKQSKFIESLMLDLPIPYIFGADNNGRLEIIDGSQRIRTLEAFLSNTLILTNLKKLDKLNNFRHSDLPLSRQKRFNRKTIRIIELTDKADRDVRKEIFERINTTPTLLKDMEVRKGVFEGDFMDFLKDCSMNGKFQLLCPISKKRTDREEASEMVLRFFAYAENYTIFDHIVRDFLDDYVKSKESGFDQSILAEYFENMLDFAQAYLPYGFRKSRNSKSTPRVRFEALSVGIHLALQKKPDLTPDRRKIDQWLNSDEFKNHTRSDGANSKSKVINRIEFVRDKLLENA